MSGENTKDQTKLRCRLDTNGDGDCLRCRVIGCPLQVFRHCMVDQTVMSRSDIERFKNDSEKFEYKEPWLGVIRGYRNKEGKVLIERLEPVPE